MYLFVKSFHAALALLSVSGLLFRVGLRLQESPVLRQRWLKIAPHMIDTLLLACGIFLAVSIQQYPFVHAWITVKVLVLLIYILLGMTALKWAQRPGAIITASTAALASFGYLIAVAVTKSPIPGL